MRTTKEAVNYRNVIPGMPKKGGRTTVPVKKELERLLLKDTTSVQSSDSENILPPNGRKQRNMKQPAETPTTNRNGKIQREPTRRSPRSRINFEINTTNSSSSPESNSVSVSSLDQSGINESLDRSIESSMNSMSSTIDISNNSQPEYNNNNNNQNISITTLDGTDGSNKKLRSGRLLSPKVDETNMNSKEIKNVVVVKQDNAEETTTNIGNVQLSEKTEISSISDLREMVNDSDKKSIVISQPPNDAAIVAEENDQLKVEIKQEPNIELAKISEEKEDIASMPMIPIVSISSPSTSSVDSAKGSSIGNDFDSGTMLYATGDIYWGRIPHFSYWACMVCPDDSSDDKPITRTNDQQLEVHVRFFADNARHNWVKRENLLPYQGLETYREHLRDLKEKCGIKSIKYQSFLPKRNQLKIWLDAVREADIIMTTPYPERLEKFFILNAAARERYKEDKIRRKSLCITQPPKLPLRREIATIQGGGGGGDGQSAAGNIAKKRNRSESPVSPAFSPLRTAKRRKTTAGLIEFNDKGGMMDDNDSDERPNSTSSETAIQTEYKTSQASPSRHNNQLYESPSFQQFHEIMKEFVMDGLQSEFVEQNLFVAVKNIWALKTLLIKHFATLDRTAMEDEGVQKNPEEEPNRKRLSLRLKELQQRHKDETTKPSTTTTTNFLVPTTRGSIERRRLSSVSLSRNKARPIEEVIDDIFNLDSRYLFDNLGRDPVCKYCLQPGGDLSRCSKGCLDWLHPACLITKNLTVPDTPRKNKVKSNGISKRRLTKRGSFVISPVDASSFPSISPAVQVQVANETSDVNQNLTVVKTEPIYDEKTADDTTSMSKDDGNVAVAVETTTTTTTTIVCCRECTNQELPKCFICHQSEKEQPSAAAAAASADGEMVKENVINCNMTHCARVYHPSCLKFWPQAKMNMTKNTIVSLRCPSHVCHTCVSDDPKRKFQHLNNANTTKCVKCPATYHMDSTCIPAGSEILTAAHIICPRHANSKTDQNVNVSWCFICVRGGQLICCETCPTAVHAECSNIALDPNESYICDECESGRMPLYGEMVWAKFNAYRWWPAIILPPTEVPLNIRNKSHNRFDFVIRFFGTHDHGWISRRRVYLYLEGDWSEQPKSKKGIDQQYLRGVLEAKQAYEIIKAKTLTRASENEGKEKLHPQPYVKIRVNRSVPPVKLHSDLEKVAKCECNPDQENPCGPDSNCINRVLYHECNPKICPAGQRCQNQMFEERISPSLDIFYTKKERGFGLRTREPIAAGTFVIEYVGEVIDSMEFERRMRQKVVDRDENYYFLYVEKDYIIDAGPKGNMARFMNHSCDPNCETQKWSVNGLNRVGLFAIKDIPADAELTFNYHWDELLGNDKKVCHCGSENCTGQIGKLSKDIRLRQSNIDEQPSSTNGKNSKVGSPKAAGKSLKRRKKNNAMKTVLRKRNTKNDTQISTKPKKVRRKRHNMNSTTTEPDNGDSKSTDQNMATNSF